MQASPKTILRKSESGEMPMQSRSDQTCRKLIAVGRLVAISLSSWKMLETTLSVTRQLLLATGTAALFWIVCMLAHLVLTDGPKSRRRIAMSIIYMIKLLVASLFSLKLAAPLIVKHTAYTASPGAPISDLLIFEHAISKAARVRKCRFAPAWRLYLGIFWHTAPSAVTVVMETVTYCN